MADEEAAQPLAGGGWTQSYDTTDPVPQADLAQFQAVEAAMRGLQARTRIGANWFWWVAGLSLINSIVALTGGHTHFVVGLGVTRIADEIAQVVAQKNPDLAATAKAMAFAWDLLVAGIVFGTGWLARKRFVAAFVIGMILYTLDGLIFLLIQQWMSVAFHGLALFCMWKGLQACLQWRALERAVLQAA